MITWELFIGISIYYFIMYATPGPNNSILTASGIKFGFIKTIPNILGIPCGHGIQLALASEIFTQILWKTFYLQIFDVQIQFSMHK